MEFKFQVYRDCDAKKLRKVVVELVYGDDVIDRRRMFGLNVFGFFQARLDAKKQKMLELAKIMVAGSNAVQL